MSKYEGCYHLIIKDITGGTHQSKAFFRSLSYEYGDSESNDYYFEVKRIPLTVRLDGLTRWNNYDIRNTSNIELTINFSVSAVNVWNNKVEASEFPCTVTVNGQEIVSDNNNYTYTFTRSGSYTFKVVTEETDKYLSDEYTETINIRDSGASNSMFSPTLWSDDKVDSNFYPWCELEYDCGINPSSLRSQVKLEIRKGSAIVQSVNGCSWSGKLSAGNYTIRAIFNGDKFYKGSRQDYSFSVKGEPTDFTNMTLKLAGSSSTNPSSVDVGNAIEITAQLKSTVKNDILSNTDYQLIIYRNNSVISKNIYTTDSNGNVSRSYKFPEEGSYRVELKYEGDGANYASTSKSISTTCGKNNPSISGWLTALYPTNTNRVYLRDSAGNPLNGQHVIWYVNGVYYDRITDNNGISYLNINLPSRNYSVKVGFNDSSLINGYNNSQNANVLVNPAYGSTSETFTMRVSPPITTVKTATSVADISVSGGRKWNDTTASKIAENNGSSYISCLNIGGKTSSVNRPNSLHLKGFDFSEIPRNATIDNIEVVVSITYWSKSGKASFEGSYCGFPALGDAYQPIRPPNENSWTETTTYFDNYGDDKKYNISASFIRNKNTVLAIDFGRNASSNIADFGLVYVAMKVNWYMPDVIA